MNERLHNFIWFEWMGANLAQAADFYGHVLGWTVFDPGIASLPYKVGAVGDYVVAGMVAARADSHRAPPCWTGFLSVENVDAAVEKLKTSGGGSQRPPWNIPNVGRAAAVVDAQGAAFNLFRPDTPVLMPVPPSPHSPGLVGWHELHANDGALAMDFYAGEFGWRQDRLHDMGPMGVYRIYKVGDQEGGVMTRAPQGPGPAWLYYFIVEAADAANARVVAKGGKVLAGPHEVPGGMFATQCADPEGALFGLVSIKR